MTHKLHNGYYPLPHALKTQWIIESHNILLKNSKCWKKELENNKYKKGTYRQNIQRGRKKRRRIRREARTGTNQQLDRWDVKRKEGGKNITNTIIYKLRKNIQKNRRNTQQHIEQQYNNQTYQSKHVREKWWHLREATVHWGPPRNNPLMESCRAWKQAMQFCKDDQSWVERRKKKKQKIQQEKEELVKQKNTV